MFVGMVFEKKDDFTLTKFVEDEFVMFFYSHKIKDEVCKTYEDFNTALRETAARLKEKRQGCACIIEIISYLFHNHHNGFASFTTAAYEVPSGKVIPFTSRLQISAQFYLENKYNTQRKKDEDKFVQQIKQLQGDTINLLKNATFKFHLVDEFFNTSLTTHLKDTARTTFTLYGLHYNEYLSDKFMTAIQMCRDRSKKLHGYRHAKKCHHRQFYCDPCRVQREMRHLYNNQHSKTVEKCDKIIDMYFKVSEFQCNFRTAVLAHCETYAKKILTKYKLQDYIICESKYCSSNYSLEIIFSVKKN